MKEKYLIKNATDDLIANKDLILESVLSCHAISEEKVIMKKKKFLIPLVAAMALMATTVYAATVLLTANEASQHLNPDVQKAFGNSEFILEVNEEQSDNGVKATFLGYALGEEVDIFRGDNEDYKVDNTYAIFAFQKEDGTAFTMEETGLENFALSPLINGYAPHEVNGAILGTSFSQAIVDGILYLGASITDIQHFAQYEVYMAVFEQTFPFMGQYNFDDASGEISVNADYAGLNLLFDLPLDSKYADTKKAEEFFESIKGENKTEVENVGGEEIDRSDAHNILPMSEDMMFDSYQFNLDDTSLDKILSSLQATDHYDSGRIYNISDGRINDYGGKIHYIEFDFQYTQDDSYKNSFSIPSDYNVGEKFISSIGADDENVTFYGIEVISDTQVKMLALTGEFEDIKNAIYNLTGSEKIHEFDLALESKSSGELTEFLEQPQFNIIHSETVPYIHSEHDGDNTNYAEVTPLDVLGASAMVFFPDSKEVGELFVHKRVGFLDGSYIRTINVISENEIEVVTYEITTENIDLLNY